MDTKRRKICIEYFKGIISKITAKYIVLKSTLIGYILHVANPQQSYQGIFHQEAKVYVHQVVREKMRSSVRFCD